MSDATPGLGTGREYDFPELRRRFGTIEGGQRIDRSRHYAIAEEVLTGRIHAHAKHGANSIEGIAAADPRWLSILVEEVGEASHELTYDATGSLRDELIDIITVATAWVAALDRDGLIPRDSAGRRICATCGDEVAYCGERHPTAVAP